MSNIPAAFFIADCKPMRMPCAMFSQPCVLRFADSLFLKELESLVIVISQMCANPLFFLSAHYTYHFSSYFHGLWFVAPKLDCLFGFYTIASLVIPP